MLTILAVFVQQILLSNGFKINKFPVKSYRALLTAVESLITEPVVLVPMLVALAETIPGRLIVDDTSNPKYGTLKGILHPLYRRLLPGIQGGVVSVGNWKSSPAGSICLVA